jgi:uncharacterized DUF497 family protein
MPSFWATCIAAGRDEGPGDLGGCSIQARYVHCAYAMDDLRFEWDERKNRSNKKKHGVSFEEARSAFLDANARLIDDPDHSDDEDRFILMGMSEFLRVVVVCHCYRQNDDVIRIISARRADSEERSSYEDKVKK